MASVPLWGLSFHHRTVEREALRHATNLTDRNELLRRWTTHHGGVYVPAGDQPPPNEHLSQVPERDIITSSGRNLSSAWGQARGTPNG